MLALAQQDSSPVVRLYLAAAVQRLPQPLGWQLVERLRSVERIRQTITSPRCCGSDSSRWSAKIRHELRVAEESRLSLISRFIVRRLADADHIELALTRIAGSMSDSQMPMLLGLRDATEGRYDMSPPANWSEVYPKLKARGGAVAELAEQLAQQFGDAEAASAMLQLLRDGQAPVEARRQALQQLAGRGRAELKADLLALLDDPPLRREAIRAVGAYDDTRLGQALSGALFRADRRRENGGHLRAVVPLGIW